MTARRSVDWSLLLGEEAPVPVTLPNAQAGDEASLLAAFDLLLSSEHVDLIWRRLVEMARTRIGLERAGVFLLDEGAGRMLGTWGTGLDGTIQDEHDVMFDVNEAVLDVFRRAERGERYFTALDNCPIVVQREKSTEVVGRGWTVCTPIRSATRRLGILYNDPGCTAAPLDEGKQTRAAILCTLVAGVVERARATPRDKPALDRADHPVVRKAMHLLAEDPALLGGEIAARLAIRAGELARLFKAELGVSLVDYRNRVRLDRFQVLIADGERNLGVAARAAGFGSYAQFHRVVRSVHASAPRDLLRQR